MFSEDFETDFGLKQNGGVMKEEHNCDLTNLDLGDWVWRDKVGSAGECLQFVQQFWGMCSIIEMQKTVRWENEIGGGFMRTETVLTLR